MPAFNEVTLDAFALVPPKAQDAARWNESRRRRRMLEGLWQEDVRERIRDYFSKVRELTMGEPALGLNLFNAVVSQKAILYDQEMTVVAPVGLGDVQKAAFAGVLNEAHLNQLLQRNCRNVIGMREGLMKLVWTENGLRFNVVPSDVVTVKTAKQDPNTLLEVAEGIILSDGRPAWEVWNIENPASPYRRIVLMDRSDVTAQVLAEPGIYNERDSQGRPFLPYVLYHAEWSDKTWNAYDNSELPNAALDLAVLWTMFGDGVRNAAWPQRYAINLRLDGATVTKGDDARAGYVDTSPTSLLMLKPIDPNAPASAGQYAPGCDPKVLGEAIIAYQSVVLSNLGINPSDLQSTQQAQSGFAIQLKRGALRREAMKVIPNFRDGDTELLAKTAMMINAYGEGAQLPEDDWGVSYNLPEIGQAELLEELETLSAMLELGLASKVDVFIKLHPDWAPRPRDQVVEHLRLIARENS